MKGYSWWRKIELCALPCSSEACGLVMSSEILSKCSLENSFDLHIVYDLE